MWPWPEWGLFHFSGQPERVSLLDFELSHVHPSIVTDSILRTVIKEAYCVKTLSELLGMETAKHHGTDALRWTSPESEETQWSYKDVYGVRTRLAVICFPLRWRVHKKTHQRVNALTCGAGKPISRMSPQHWDHVLYLLQAACLISACSLLWLKCPCYLSPHDCVACTHGITKAILMLSPIP